VVLALVLLAMVVLAMLLLAVLLLLLLPSLLLLASLSTAQTAFLITMRRQLIAAVFAPDALAGSCVHMGAIA
jgi:hypothetical protein